MGVGISARRLAVLALASIAAVALWALPAGAGAAKLIGKDGKVYACYKAKGKSKGAVRLVPKKGKCKRGEKKVSWGAAGPAGESGGSGENGTNGASGTGGETGTAGTKGLEGRISALTTKLTSLESVLQGITNGDLVGMLAKLQGISGTQLQETVASLAKVNALCAQTSKVTSQADALGESLGGLKLVTGLPVVLETIAPIPTPLSSFACP